jgi:Replication-relaxation
MNIQERTTATRPGKITATHLTTLGSRLTDRDRQIALDCYDHRVLTTEQLMRLHFGGLRTTTLRLGTLYQLRVLDRFRPPRRRPGTGTHPYHWILDEAGAHVVAAQRDTERRRLRWQHSDAVDIAQSSKLRHHIEINEFFSLLSLEAQLQHGALHEWYGERITSTLFKGVVPDGYGVINLPHRPLVHLLLELDRGTEPARRLHDKAVLYARQIPRSQLGEHDAFVVLTVPTATRAKLAREAVAGTGAPIVVAEWSKASTHSPLAILTDAAEQIAARRLAPAMDRAA